MRVIEEVGADKYRATPLSAALTVPKYHDAIVFWYVLISYVDSLADDSPAPKQAGPFFRNCQPSLKRPGTKSPWIIQLVLFNSAMILRSDRPCGGKSGHISRKHLITTWPDTTKAGRAGWILAFIL